MPPDLRPVLAALLALLCAGPVASAEIDAEELVRGAEERMRGQTSELKATMHITTPRWSRSVTFRSWDDRRGDRSLTRILAPRKDKGTGFLRLGSTLWTYLPRVERTMRIPPSMMLQSWMGSDFTNDDVARESSLIDDYDAMLLSPRQVGGVEALGVRLEPHEDAPVVWGKIELWVTAADLTPLEYLYFDEPHDGVHELVRTMRFSEIRTVQGRAMPHRWSIIPADKPGHSTEVVIDEIHFDLEFADGQFTVKRLKRVEAAR
jgi:outer membrane lipoprotein-sorting protein